MSPTSTTVRFLGLLLVLSLQSSTAWAQRSEPSIAELSAWAEDMVVAGRGEQLRVRFEPLLKRWARANAWSSVAELSRAWGAAESKAIDPWRWLAEAEVERQNFAEALAAVARAKAAGAGTSASAAAIERTAALAYWELAQPELAEQAFQRALRHDDAALTRIQWTRFLLWGGRGHEAWAQARTLEGEAQRDGAVALLVARSCSAAKAPLPESSSAGTICSPAVAVRLFEQAVQLRPEHSEAYYGLSLALRAVGDRERAAASMRRYRELLSEDLAPKHASRG